MRLKKIVEELDLILQRNCSKGRYAHIQRVTATCVQLAKHFGVEEEKAELVGLGHDMVREWPEKKLLKLAVSRGYEPTRMERRRPILLHGRCAAILFQRDFDLSDSSVLRALEDHTLGRAGMDMLGILLYVSDYIEPGRKHATKKFRDQILKLPPWEMVLAVNRHARKRNKKRNPLTRQLDKYAGEMAAKNHRRGKKED